jgi:hypothetical protein
MAGTISQSKTLHYDYFNLDVAVGKSDVPLDGRELNIDNDTFDVSARVVAFLPVLENVDLIAEAGVLHSRLDQKTRGHADYVGQGKENETDFMWKAVLPATFSCGL